VPGHIRQGRTNSLATGTWNEWILYASFADEQPCVPEAEVLDTLTRIWVTSIYEAFSSGVFG
jgi:hypothetical protein